MDVFPIKSSGWGKFQVESDYSVLWKVSYHGNYKLLKNIRRDEIAVLWQCGTPKPQVEGATAYFEIVISDGPLSGEVLDQLLETTNVPIFDIQGPRGAANWVESRLAEPDALLADFALAIWDHQSPKNELTFLRNVRQQDAGQEISAATICTDIDAVYDFNAPANICIDDEQIIISASSNKNNHNLAQSILLLLLLLFSFFSLRFSPTFVLNILVLLLLTVPILLFLLAKLSNSITSRTRSPLSLL